MSTAPGSGEEELVSGEMSEALLGSVERGIRSTQEGVFGPASQSWVVNRESALFLGAGRAALLQLAHPWVAASLSHHSRVLSDPIARFHNTFRVVYAMIFGTAGQALSASRQLHALHTRIRGSMPESAARYRAGSLYQANELGALRWVHATLIESAVLAYQAALPALSRAELDAFYSDSKRLGALFGIPPEALPGDWAAFEAYNRAMWESDVLGVTELSRAMAHKVLTGAESWLRPPRWYRALTASWMPGRLRREFALPFGPAEQRAAARARRWLPRIYPLLPLAIRFVGPYQEAQGRLRGQSAPGMLIRASNRFWTGQPRLMGAPAAGARPIGAGGP